MNQEASRRILAFVLIFIAPTVAVPIFIGASYFLGSRENVLAGALPFLLPLVGLLGISQTNMRVAAKVIFAIIYLPLCAVGVFIAGIGFGCSTLKMHCW